ncbi:MAG TPA: M20/M25/M40 family metallo-hydrolase [Gemmatimonadales bacterium]|nr:M20/M25/M40 family metallo-hydrolase [Gemmatimonadales bacterium]
MRPLLRGLAALAALAAGATLGVTPLHAQASARDQEARAIFAELIGINSTAEHGATTPAAQAVARRLLAAGFPERDVAIVGPDSLHQNIVARLRGTGARRPILLLAHLDVVEALRSDWTMEPFTLTERDGYFYGRGTSDIKDMAAIFTATMLSLKRDGVVPDRDIILALTAGEESGAWNGVQWLLDNRRDLIDAAYCINGDGGDPLSRNGVVYARNVQASEKVYTDFELEVHNPGGHSSLPTADNAIYRLSAGLVRLGRFRFPARLNEITRGYFERAAASNPPNVARDMRLAAGGNTPAIARLSNESPYFNALFRTTCVATRVNGGHADNALPQLARATVNCRMLPDEKPEAVEATIRRVVADSGILVRVKQPAVPSPASPLVPEVMEPIEAITRAMWPGAAVVPSMETGATDGLYLRNAGIPVYGVSGVALDVDDIRAHGQDERIRVKAFYEGVEFTERFVRALSGGR